MCLFEYDVETCPECGSGTRINFRQPPGTTSSPSGICAVGLAEQPPTDKAETCPHRFDWHSTVDNHDRVMPQPCGVCRDKAELRKQRLKRAEEWARSQTLDTK